MDDILDSCESEAELFDMVEQFLIINKHAGFKLHGWASNCPSVLTKLGINQSSEENLFESNETKQKVLGLRWITAKDQLTFNLDDSKNPKEILSPARRSHPRNENFCAYLRLFLIPQGV